MSREIPLEIDPKALGARLRAARNARGLTQGAVAEHLGVARTTVVAIEKGERKVRPEELVNLAQLYGRRLSELLQRSEPTAAFVDQFRGLAEDDLLLPDVESFELLCRDYADLERLCGASRRRDPQTYEFEGIDPETAAEDVATAERARLALGEGPLPNLRETLENDVGLRIFQPELPQGVEALYAFGSELGGCFAVNRLLSAEGRHLALAHAWAHFLTERFRPRVLLTGRYERLPAHERFAKRFALAFSMPAEGLRRRYLELLRERGGNGTLGDLRRLARFYGVSLEAMIQRLEALRLIAAGSWRRLEDAGFAEEARAADPEIRGDRDLLPPRYVALAIECWQRGELSEGQLARFLRTDRLGARGIVENFSAGSEPDDTPWLAEPLLQAVG